MKRKLALPLCLVCLLVSNVFAASHDYGLVLSADGKHVTVTKPSTHITPRSSDAGLKTISSNLSTYPNATYFSIWGNTVAQGGANFPFQTWVAVAFTPTADATVTKLEVSAGRQGGGTTGFELGLYNDAGGVPGTVIKSSHVSRLPNYGECCQLAVANAPSGIPVKAGTQYWVVVSTTAADTDIYAWAFNSTDMRAQTAASWCSGPSTYCGSSSGMWVPYSYVQLGYAVMGQ